MSKLSDIEGIGEKYANKLKEAGVTTIENLLEKCCSKKGRSELAGKTGIKEKMILIWVNKADLARINGVSTQYADLLKYTGVDTIAELAQRNPENLFAKIVEANEGGVLVKKLPTQSQVSEWIVQAKELPRLITY